MRLSVPVAVLAAAMLAGCSVPQDQNTPVSPRWMSDPATNAGYYLYVPSTYRPAKPAPVIVTCHGTDPYDVAAYQIGEWKKLAEQYGCILVCPKLTSTDGLFGSGSIDALLHDEWVILSVFGQLHYMYNIDRRNVLITGFSGGGFPVYFVGLRHPDIFSVAVARSCNFNRQALEDWYPASAMKTPVKVYYGENDFAGVRSQSDSAIAYLRSAGFIVEQEVIPKIGHERRPEVAMRFWLKHWNGTAPLPSR
jgi:poly(3-hydroxybutyrate) depolymerase